MLIHGDTSPSGSQSPPDSLLDIRTVPGIPPEYGLTVSQVTPLVKSCITNSRRSGTREHYNSKLVQWKDWCIINDISPINCPIADVLNFLGHLKSIGRAYSTIGLARSAISAVHSLCDGVPIGQHPLISRFMKGVFNSIPPVPKYAGTWDVQAVLNVLQSPLFADNHVISFHNLQVKVVLLILISTACRISVLLRLQVNSHSICDRGDHFLYFPRVLIKLLVLAFQFRNCYVLTLWRIWLFLLIRLLKCY